MALSPAPATAATILTWDQSVQRVRDTNDAIQAARARVEAQQHLETVAASNFYPQLALRYDGAYSGDDNNGDTVARHSSLSLNLSQNLFAGLADFGRLRQAVANTHGAEADLIAAQAQASYDLKTRFETYAYALDSVALSQEIIKRRQDNLQMVQLRYESGRENKGSVLLSRANLEQANYDRVLAEDTKRSSKYGLATVLAMENPDEFEITGAVPTSAPSKVPSFLELLPAVPEHLRAVATEDAAEYATSVSRAGFFPTLDLLGSVGRSSVDDFNPNSTRSWSLGLRLTFPIFTGLSTLGSVRASAASHRSASFARRNVDHDQLTTLVEAYNKYVEAVQKYKVDQSFRDAAQVRAEIGRRKYNNGLLSFEDWDVIENDLINRQKQFLATKRDRVIAEAAWERAQGRSVFP